MKTSIIAECGTLLAKLSELFLWSESVDMAYAWASSASEKGPHWKVMDLGKVNRAVIGTEFAQTEPQALTKFGEKPGRLRLIISSSGTFHPKVILGSRGNQRRAIVGSANFTQAAVTSNTELCVYVEGLASDKCFSEIEDFIAEQWDRGVSMTPEWLEDYTKVWSAAQKRRVVVPLAKLDVTSMTSLQMGWSDYMKLIEAQEGRPLKSGYKISVFGRSESYFRELDDTKAIFARNDSFASLSRDERNLLMGMGGSSGLLGTMRAAGYAKELVNKRPDEVGKILDQLPLEGEVPLGKVETLLNALTSLKGVKIGVATRLFAVKRPDLFVSVNNGSKPQLAAALGGRSIATVKHYIDLLRTLWLTDWHRSPMPTDTREAAVWKRRAALLDAALYEQVE